MEQKNGKLSIFKSKKGKTIVKVLFADEKGKAKEFTVQNITVSEEYNGKDIEFQMEKGQISRIICEEKELFSMNMKMKNQPQAAKFAGRETRQVKKTGYAKTSSAQPSENHMEMDHLEKVQYPASAPYNFIPLNKTVVEVDELPDFDKYYEGRKTGWIDLEIETVTPLYIRDTLNDQERKKKAESEKKKEKYDNPEFFSPGKLRIPGSSLRGMVRTFMEIVSFGKFGFYDDKRLYFRSFADITESLKKIYSDKMIQQIQGAYAIRPLGGYLKRQGNKFVIIPALLKNKVTYYKIEESLLLGKSFYSQAMSVNFTNKKGESRYKPNKNYKFFIKQVFFKKESPKVHNHTKKLYYGRVTAIQENITNSSGWEKGTLVCTGWVPSKNKGKHMHWIVNEKNPSPTSSEILEIKDELLKSYKDDVSREEQADLLKQLENHPEGVPCFYITDEQGQLNSFGHTGMFRLAYEKNIGEHIPEDLNPEHPKNKSKTDLAEAIFGKVGKEKTIPGRVFFEDAFLKEGQQDKNVLMDKATPKILAAPKPTAFQHYLAQIQDDSRQLNHCNSNSAIRGYKLYWHKSGNNWEQTNQKEIQEYKSQYTEIAPVKPNTIFSGRIRFENLSKIELGALLFSLDLPEGCYHKLGMGKPLGMGSVKITPKLHISDRKKRYTNLFAEWSNEIPESDKAQDMKNAFEQYVLNVLKKAGEQQESLWDTDRLKELKLMLNYETGKKLESNGEIRYMEIQEKGQNEFKFRRILPKPSGLIGIKENLLSKKNDEKSGVSGLGASEKEKKILI